MKLTVNQTEAAYRLVDGEFQCQHLNYHVETGETWPTGPEDDGYEFDYYVCDDCDEQIDGDPATDRAEGLADYQAEMAREDY